MRLLPYLIRVLSRLTKVLEKKVPPESLPEGVTIHPKSRIARHRLHLKPEIRLSVDRDSLVDGSIYFERENARISIGKRVFMNGTLIASSKIDIEDDVLVAWGVTIVDHDSHAISFANRANDVLQWRENKKSWAHVRTDPVKIAAKAWVGFNSIILCGVTVGEGAIVGAGSVVKKDVPPWTIVAGNPAQIIREIPESER
jgi:acetyltransferase-like isoleucine patch superfamily enzyme